MGKQLVKQWTNEENQYISDNYLKMTDEQMAEHLSGRTPKAVQSERQKLKLYRPMQLQAQKVIKNKGDKKITFQDIKRLAEEKDYILLSTETDYKNQSSKLSYKCKKHLDMGVMQITGGHLSQGHGCKYCGRERSNMARLSKVTELDDRKLCEEKGFEYIRTEKNGNYFCIYFICPKHAFLGNNL